MSLYRTAYVPASLLQPFDKCTSQDSWLLQRADSDLPKMFYAYVYALAVPSSQFSELANDI